MIGKLNHVAIAVKDIGASIEMYQNVLGAIVHGPTEQKEHGVKVAFVELSNTKIELITPLGENSPLDNFLKRYPSGGIHHICYEVPNIYDAKSQILQRGGEILGSGEPKTGAHGKRILFLDPKSFDGTLIELEEV